MATWTLAAYHSGTTDYLPCIYTNGSVLPARFSLIQVSRFQVCVAPSHGDYLCKFCCNGHLSSSLSELHKDRDVCYWTRSKGQKIRRSPMDPLMPHRKLTVWSGRRSRYMQFPLCNTIRPENITINSLFCLVPGLLAAVENYYLVWTTNSVCFCV